ncbi:MAG TPA: biopolymer transporter ExbD [Gemmatimonadales bacterium]|nr:biopolymer transporter ExbD [Gemmatimonadales bacterium]
MKRRRRRRLAIGFASAAVSDINITPMVDVLLCLLILVMVIQPGLLKGLDIQVPPVETGLALAADAPRDQIILHVASGPAYAINSIEVPADQLEQRIREVFQGRGRKVLFLKGAEDVRYEDVVRAADVAKAAGIRVVGLVPRDKD